MWTQLRHTGPDCVVTELGGWEAMGPACLASSTDLPSCSQLGSISPRPHPFLPVWLASSPGRGELFALDLPLTHCSSWPQAQSRQQATHLEHTLGFQVSSPNLALGFPTLHRRIPRTVDPILRDFSTMVSLTLHPLPFSFTSIQTFFFFFFSPQFILLSRVVLKSP